MAGGRLPTALAAGLLLMPARGRARDELRGLARELAGAAADAGLKRVAIAAFVPVDDDDPEPASLLAERLAGLLFREEKVRLVERRLIGGVLRERFLTAAGVVASRETRASELSPVDAVIVGSLSQTGERAEAHVRLVRVDGGEIVFAASCTVEAPEPPVGFLDDGGDAAWTKRLQRELAAYRRGEWILRPEKKPTE